VGTVISFEVEPPDADEMRRRIDAALETHDWVVLDDDGTVRGYAYAAPHKARAAYRWSCEVSVYVDRDSHRSGAGRLLYESLLSRLADRGYRTVVAGMTLPNEASTGLHRALGFEPVGVFRSIGHKHGSWHDVGYVQRRLG
jgi:phosphinothricin acetyltransferase